MTSRNHRIEAIETARTWLAEEALFLDTETTGLGRHAQVCEVSVVDVRGAILLDRLVKPTVPIPAGAAAVHGIRDADVADAPSFAEALPKIEKVLAGRLVIVYNVDYDYRLLVQSAEVHGAAFGLPRDRWDCAMALYAEYVGDWDERYRCYRSHKLSKAASDLSLDVPENLHRAAADAELTRRVVKALAEKTERVQGALLF